MSPARAARIGPSSQAASPSSYSPWRRATVASVEPRIVGLRAQDVYSGLQTVDQTSGLIAAELGTTRLTGMAATVASNIKGVDVIRDVRVLTVVASQEWGIDAMALPQVLEALQEVGYVTLHKDVRGKVTSVDESVPLLHDHLYEELGEHWASNDPSELDEAAVESLEVLATAPLLLSELEERIGDADTVSNLLEVGDAAQFARRLALPDGDELVWSPFCAYEQPEKLSTLFASFSQEEIRQQFARVRSYQGTPVEGQAGVLGQAVGHGILLANTVVGSGGEAAFAFVPYQASAEQRRMQKVVLEKALILLACVRYGQHKARFPVHHPSAILRKLRRGEPLRATTEAGSQYRTAAQQQVLRLEPAGGGFYNARLIDTPDNVSAVELSIDLAEHGEPVAAREDPAQKLLFTGEKYLAPLMTMKERSGKARLTTDTVLSIYDTFRGEA